MDLNKVRRERMRWMILTCLYVARPIGISEAQVVSIIGEEFPDVTPAELRRELDYLRDRKLVDLDEKKNKNNWFLEINWHGVNVVEYSEECLPGIARPERD